MVLRRKGGSGARASGRDDAGRPAISSASRWRRSLLFPVTLALAGVVLIAILAAVLVVSGALDSKPSRARQVSEVRALLQRTTLVTAELPPSFVVSSQTFQTNDQAAAADVVGTPVDNLARFAANGRLIGLLTQYEARNEAAFSQPGNPLVQLAVTLTAFESARGARSDFDFRRQNLDNLQHNSALALANALGLQQVRILTSPQPDVGEDRFSFHLEAQIQFQGRPLTVLYEYICFLRGKTVALLVGASVGGPSPMPRQLAARQDERIQKPPR